MTACHAAVTIAKTISLSISTIYILFYFCAQSGYPEYTRRHELILSHLSVYRAAVSAHARKMVLLGVCELAGVTPPDVNLGSETFDGEAMIRECVDLHVRALEAKEEQLRLMEEETKRRRLAAMKTGKK